MSPRPYRTPAEVEDPPPAAEERSLGSVRSVHAPPPLRRSLLVPVLLASVMFVVMVVCDVPAWLSFLIASTVFGVLGWSPLGTRGLVVTLHTEGLVVSRGEKRSEIFFDDIDEVWFEIPSLRWSQVTYLSALKLFDFEKRTHRIPLAISDGVTLTNAILRGYGAPLLRDARKALAEGKMLSFGAVNLSRAGITVKGTHAPWGEIRRALVQPGCVSFYRRFPIFAWRTVRLDRIPNPSIFCALAGDCVKLVTDTPLMIERLGAGATLDRSDSAFRTMFLGGAAFLVGLLLTANSLLAGRTSWVAIGPMVFGVIAFVRGFTAFRRGR